MMDSGGCRGVAPALGREPGEGGELVASMEALPPGTERGVDFLERKALTAPGVDALEDFVLQAEHGLVV
jgi:hypothetical protein